MYTTSHTQHTSQRQNGKTLSMTKVKSPNYFILFIFDLLKSTIIIINVPIIIFESVYNTDLFYTLNKNSKNDWVH